MVKKASTIKSRKFKVGKGQVYLEQTHNGKVRLCYLDEDDVAADSNWPWVLAAVLENDKGMVEFGRISNVPSSSGLIYVDDDSM